MEAINRRIKELCGFHNTLLQDRDIIDDEIKLAKALKEVYEHLASEGLRDGQLEH